MKLESSASSSATSNAVQQDKRSALVSDFARLNSLYSAESSTSSSSSSEPSNAVQQEQRSVLATDLRLRSLHSADMDASKSTIADLGA